MVVGVLAIVGLAAVTLVGLLLVAVLTARMLAALHRLRAQAARTRGELEPHYRAYRARTRGARQVVESDPG